MPKIIIGLEQENPVHNVADTIISTPGLKMPRYRHELANVTALTITRVQHNIARVTSVTVTDVAGNVIWVNMGIDPQTGTVTIQAEIPVTGFVLID